MGRPTTRRPRARGRRRRGGAASGQPRQGRRRAQRAWRACRGRGVHARAADGRRPAAPARRTCRGSIAAAARRADADVIVGRAQLRSRAACRALALLVERHRQLGARRRSSGSRSATRSRASGWSGCAALEPIAADVDRLRDRDRDADPPRPPRRRGPAKSTWRSPTRAPPASCARSATPPGRASWPSTTASLPEMTGRSPT